MALKISFKAEARTDKNGEGVTHKLYIYDPVHGGYDIDPESWEFHTSETSAAYFRKALEAVSKSDTIEVHINSAGGSVKEGLGCYICKSVRDHYNADHCGSGCGDLPVEHKREF